MMGIREREFRPLPDNLSLEELVPKDNFYRRLEDRIDLSLPCFAAYMIPVNPGNLAAWDRITNRIRQFLSHNFPSYMLPP